MPPRVAKPLRADLLLAALEALGGAALVLDADLVVRAASPSARRLLGGEPVGASAARVLCGDGPAKPVAEALAAGRPVHAVLPHPSRGARHLSVRTIPMKGSARAGWVVLLDELAVHGEDGVVEFHGMWTGDAGMKEVFRLVTRVARGTTTVLVRGDTGTGKELVAHAIHALSPRAAGPFVVLNCAALPGTLLETELFGHARGAFTGAVSAVPGHVQLAHGGTLFLDEVAELPLELQAKLLRVLETRTVIPVGGRTPIPVDVRFVSATHRALRKEVEAGRFRGDLMYRLRVIPIFLPPLQARRGDVALLTRVLLAEARAKGETTLEQVSPAAQRALDRYDWPGNVRELKNTLAYAAAMASGPVLLPTDLPPEITSGSGREAPLSGAREVAARAEDPEADRISRALRRAQGNRGRAAAALGMSRVTLWRRMRELRLPRDGA